MDFVVVLMSCSGDSVLSRVSCIHTGPQTVAVVWVGNGDELSLGEDLVPFLSFGSCVAVNSKLETSIRSKVNE